MSPRRAPRESTLEDFFRESVRKAGGRTTKIIPIEAGWPDRLALFPGGRAHLVELKKDGGIVSPIQRHRHSQLATIGWHVHVIYGRQGITDFIRAVVDSMSPHSRAVARRHQA